MSYLKIIEYWENESVKDFEVAKGLCALKHYSYCLFFCHLVLEKMLKAFFVAKHREQAPHIHDLVILARKSGIMITTEQKDSLETITMFNIQGRYPDYKSKFYKKYNNKKSAEKYLTLTGELLAWLKKESIRK